MIEHGERSVWYREPYVWLLIAIPACAVVAGFVTLALAIATDDGLVVDDYYWQGKQINRVLCSWYRAGATIRTRDREFAHHSALRTPARHAGWF